MSTSSWTCVSPKKHGHADVAHISITDAHFPGRIDRDARPRFALEYGVGLSWYLRKGFASCVSSHDHRQTV